MKELNQGLSQLEEMLSGWQAKPAAKEIGRLREALAPHNELTVVELCRLIQAANGQARPRSAKAAQPNTDLVSRWVADLQAAQADDTAFADLLKRAGSLKAADLSAVADGFTGVRVKHSKKADAIKLIEQQRQVAQSARRREGHLGDIF